MVPLPLRLLNALSGEDRGLKVRFSLATIVFERFELILCQMLSSQGKNAPSNPYHHHLVRLATSRSKPTRKESLAEASLEPPILSHPVLRLPDCTYQRKSAFGLGFEWSPQVCPLKRPLMFLEQNSHRALPPTSLNEELSVPKTRNRKRRPAL